MQLHGGQLMLTTQLTTQHMWRCNSWLAWYYWIRIWQVGTSPLVNRLEGEAAVYKRLLDRKELRQPNGRGVEYFKRTLRPHFVKGAQTVFLCRLTRSMEKKRKFRLDEMDDQIPNRRTKAWRIMDGLAAGVRSQLTSYPSWSDAT